MSNKAAITTNFNSIIGNFMESMIGLLGGIYDTTKVPVVKDTRDEINKFHLLLQTYFKANFYGGVELFLLHVIPYRHIIDNCDESFFLGNEINAVLNSSLTKENVASEDSNSIILTVLNLKNVWGYISAENRQVIFQYLQALCGYTVEYAKIAHPELFN